MLKKRFAVLVSMLLVLMFSATLLSPAALAVSVPLLSGNTGGTTGGTNGEGEGGDTPAPGGVEITGYYVQTGGVVPSKITKGMGIGLSMTILDKREETVNIDVAHIDVAARLNTSSFRVMNANAIRADAPVSTANGLSYYIYLELVYLGVGNSVQLDLYYNHKGTQVAHDVPVYPLSLTLNQCVPTEGEGGTEVKGTGFVLKSASYGEGKVEAGKNFTLSAEVLATNGGTNVENVTVSITPPEQITLAEGGSMAYVGTVAPNQVVPVNFQLFPGGNIEDGSYTIAIDIKGVSASDGSDVSATMNFTVPVIQPERFEIFESQLPGYLTIGMDDGSGYGSVTLVNQGKGTVSNVSVEVVGDGLSTEEGKEYMGHIAGGEQKTADFLLVAMEPGQIEAKVVVTYESTSGEQKTLEESFSVMVEEGYIDPGMPVEPMPEETQGFPAWGIALIVVGIVIAAVIVLIVVLRRRKAKRAALEQADLEDNDEDDGFDDEEDTDSSEDDDENI